MGLDRNNKTPCGFCFVESVARAHTAPATHRADPARPPRSRFFHHDQALSSLRYISGTKLDERIVRADLDPGFLDGRQYGRGKSGGQVRDEYREDFDSGRGALQLSGFKLTHAQALTGRHGRAGGWGHLKTRQEMEEGRQKEQDDLYREDHEQGRGGDVPSGMGGGGDEVSHAWAGSRSRAAADAVSIAAEPKVQGRAGRAGRLMRVPNRSVLEARRRQSRRAHDAVRAPLAGNVHHLREPGGGQLDCCCKPPQRTSAICRPSGGGPAPLTWLLVVVSRRRVSTMASLAVC